jgi:hypothetical protein
MLLVLSLAFAAPPTLVDPGEAPHTLLAPAPAEGTVQRARLRLELSARSKHDGAPVPTDALPPLGLDLAAEVTAASPLAYRVTVEGVSVDGGEEGLREAMSAALKPLVGLTGEVRATSDGPDVSWSPTHGADPELRTEVTKALQVLAVPLPAAPVGVGASWTVTRPVQSALPVTQHETWTVHASDDGRVELHAQVRQEATLGQAVEQGLPEGATGTLTKHLSLGETRVVLDPRKPLPVEIAEGMTTKYTVELVTDEATTELVSIVGYQLSLTERPPSP